MNGCKKTEEEFLIYAESVDPIEKSGSCAIILLIVDNMVYSANVGDSRAVLSRNKGSV
jgi:serine/threonine protein phosphatase PrpC